MTVQSESIIKTRHAFKMAKYVELVAGLRRGGHPTRLFALDCARSLVATTA